MNPDDLKPCPLCGGEPNDKGYGIVCRKCGLWLGDGTQSHELGGYHYVWNMRAENDDLLKENKRLCDALLACKHRVETMRIWGGTGWSWQNLHAKAIYETIVKALNDKP